MALQGCKNVANEAVHIDLYLQRLMMHIRNSYQKPKHFSYRTSRVLTVGIIIQLHVIQKKRKPSNPILPSLQACQMNSDPSEENRKKRQFIWK